MKRRLLALILILSLMSLACKAVSGQDSVSTPQVLAPASTSTNAPQEPTKNDDQLTETQQATETELPAETVAPTSKVEIENTATLSPSETPTQEPSPTPSGSIADTFDTALAEWSKPWIVTTQSPRMKSSFTTSKGRLLYDIKDKETYAYQFHKNSLEANVSVQTTYENLGTLNNSIVLVCRATPDNSAWYEARVSSKGTYAFFRYDRSLKEDGGRNPYVELASGGVNFNFLFPDKSNTLIFTCNGDTLTLDVNNGLKVFSVQDGTLRKGGLVGLGALSFQDLDVTVSFDEFKANNLP